MMPSPLHSESDENDIELCIRNSQEMTEEGEQASGKHGSSRTYWSTKDVKLFIDTLLEYKRRGEMRNNNFGKSWTKICKEFNSKAEFRQSQEQMSQRFIAPNIIAPRNEQVVHPRIRDSSKFYPWFKDCVGAIDGTHVPTFVPAAYQDAFRNRKGNITQNVLLACDYDMRFIFVYAGWEGSTHDSRILQSALSRQGVNFPMPPLGKYYVVDSAFKNMPGFMAPFRGVRYHMQDFTGRSRSCSKNSRRIFQSHSFFFTKCDRKKFWVFEASFCLP